MANYKWTWNEDLKLYRAGCGCRMRIENQDGTLTKRFTRVCKTHQEAK